MKKNKMNKELFSTLPYHIILDIFEYFNLLVIKSNFRRNNIVLLNSCNMKSMSISDIFGKFGNHNYRKTFFLWKTVTLYIDFFRPTLEKVCYIKRFKEQLSFKVNTFYYYIRFLTSNKELVREIKKCFHGTLENEKIITNHSIKYKNINQEFIFFLKKHGLF